MLKTTQFQWTPSRGPGFRLLAVYSSTSTTTSYPSPVRGTFEVVERSLFLPSLYTVPRRTDFPPRLFYCVYSLSWFSF